MKLDSQTKQTLTLGHTGYFDDQLEELFAEIERFELQVERRRNGKRKSKTAGKSQATRSRLQ